MTSSIFALVLAAAPSVGQSTPSTESSFLRLYAETRRFGAGRPVKAEATPDGKSVLFLRAQPTAPEQTLYLFDVATGKTRELLTPEKVLNGAAEKMSAAEKARLERQRVTARGFTSYDLSEDGKKILVALSGRLYVVTLADGKVLPLATGEGAAIDPQFSPDGSKIGYVRDNDVQVLELAANKEKRVTKGGTDVLTHGLAEFVAQEEMSRYSGFWWSPDARWIAYEEADHSKVEKFGIVDPMHPESGAESFFYPRPGKENVRVRLGVTPAGGGATAWVSWDAAKYPYVATVTWPAKGPLNVLVQNRAQTEQALLSVDPKTGKTKELLVEKDEAWLNLDQAFPHWLEDGSGFLWFTERNGGPEIELRAATGELKSSWVKPDAGFFSFAGFDEKRRILYFSGSPNPTESHVFRVKEGGAPEQVKTDEGGAASETAELSKDGSLLLVLSTSTLHMPRTAVFKADGGKLGELPSVAVEPPLKLAIEIRKVGAGEGIWASIIRPTNFKKGQKLPVIVDIYGGPGHLQVAHSMRENLLAQWLADQGYLVVKFDGHGTPRRGRAWERSIKNDFSKTLDDQVGALQALAKEIPEMDLARVGVQGWSFGGYLSALAVLKRPDVFKAAASGAPVVDWADYDTHYTERYVGTPQDNPKGYEVGSLLTYAPKLERPLLVIHGTADDNVYFFHSLKLSDALFRAGRPHQILPLSNFTHMVPDPLVTERLYERIARHFKENL
jgi:dipeptidyl-peptidase 4